MRGMTTTPPEPGARALQLPFRNFSSSVSSFSVALLDAFLKGS